MLKLSSTLVPVFALNYSRSCHRSRTGNGCRFSVRKDTSASEYLPTAISFIQNKILTAQIAILRHLHDLHCEVWRKTLCCSHDDTYDYRYQYRISWVCYLGSPVLSSRVCLPFFRRPPHHIAHDIDDNDTHDFHGLSLEPVLVFNMAPTARLTYRTLLESSSSSSGSRSSVSWFRYAYAIASHATNAGNGGTSTWSKRKRRWQYDEERKPSKT